MPRAEARFVASDEVLFCSLGGIGAVPVFANGSAAGGRESLAPLGLDLETASASSFRFSVEPVPSTTVSRAAAAAPKRSTGRSASRRRRAPQRSCSVERRSSVRSASGSFVSFAAAAKEVDARAWEEAAARSVLGECGGAEERRMLDAVEACWCA